MATDAGLMQEIAHQHLFDQSWLTHFFVVPMVLVARAVDREGVRSATTSWAHTG